MFVVRTLLFAIGACAALDGCGTHVTPSVFADDGSTTPQDSGVPPADAPFPCGPGLGVTCEPSQYCQVGCAAGPIFCAAPLDSGACPANYALSHDCSDAAPCVSTGGYATMCLDDPGAATCPGAPPGPSRTIECDCGL
jgi:hypothetical protein